MAAVRLLVVTSVALPRVSACDAVVAAASIAGGERDAALWPSVGIGPADLAITGLRSVTSPHRLGPA